MIDEVRNGVHKELFDPANLISRYEGASNNFARGRYTLGTEFLEVCLDRIRKLAENCKDLEGFLIYNSVGGGTGSGFGSLLLE